jgi:hypothetical protein
VGVRAKPQQAALLEVLGELTDLVLARALQTGEMGLMEVAAAENMVRREML